MVEGEKNCKNCKHYDPAFNTWPCDGWCEDMDKFEPKEGE